MTRAGFAPTRQGLAAQLGESGDEVRLSYPAPTFETTQDLLAAATDPAADDKILEDTVVWRMERESASA